MESIVDDRRSVSMGQILDLVAPGADGTERKTIEARVARWTREQMFYVVGATTRTGSGRHRLYPLSEAALIAIAHSLHEHGLRATAIAPVTARLRDGLASRPGANSIDLALEAVRGGETKSAAARAVRDDAGLIAFTRDGGSERWRPIDPDAIAGHAVTITLNLRLALACLAPLLLAGEALAAVKSSRQRAAPIPERAPTRQAARPPRYSDLRAKFQAGKAG